MQAEQNEQGQDYPVRPVPFTAVQLNDQFWAPRIETNRAVTIPFAFEQCETSGRMDLFRRAAAKQAGEQVDPTPPPYPFDDTDVYKVVEGAAYTLSVHPDAELERYVDGLVELIAAAQEPDGYLYTTRTISPEGAHKWAGAERWQLERELSHELYNLGHLYEAAVAYEQATGKGGIMEIARKTADLLDRTFGPDKAVIWPGHQITEMGLVKMFHATGDRRYLDLAKFMLDKRGPDGSAGSGSIYNQSHQPVTEQAEAVGHAVRATYMYAGMADVAAVTGDSAYIAPLDRVWEDVVARKLYITGGIGANPDREAFGPAYSLPNDTAYAETCAAIGNVYWNERLFLLHADARYIDVLERSLYNGLLSGVGLDGMSFFYDNPLESAGQHERSPWFGCACCPSNVSRFLPSLPGYVYGQQADDIYVNLYVSGSAEIKLQNGLVVRLTQQTKYPWEGAIRLLVEPEQAGEFAINVRIPGWARDEPVPSDLYRYADRADEQPVLLLNGQPLGLDIERGYVSLRRMWQAGDVIDLMLPMPVRRVVAHEAVEADRGKVALQRGPLVYCAEWADNDGQVSNIELAADVSLSAEFEPELLGGVAVIKWRQGEREIRAIPYYAWANRGPGEMAVWIAEGQGGRA